jgi:hypothetical protein
MRRQTQALIAPVIAPQFAVQLINRGFNIPSKHQTWTQSSTARNGSEVWNSDQTLPIIATRHNNSGACVVYEGIPPSLVNNQCK